MKTYYVVYRRFDIGNEVSPCIATVSSYDRPTDTDDIFFFESREDAKSKYLQIFEKYIRDIEYTLETEKSFMEYHKKNWDWESLYEYEDVNSIKIDV